MALLVAALELAVALCLRSRAGEDESQTIAAHRSEH
jgi:hypothetical protein